MNILDTGPRITPHTTRMPVFTQTIDGCTCSTTHLSSVRADSGKEQAEAEAEEVSNWSDGESMELPVHKAAYLKGGIPSL